MENRTKNLRRGSQSMDLVTEIYKTTQEFPTQEIYGITNQVRRAAVSVPSNIAEGAARQTKKEFRNFLHVAQGSLSEWDTQIEIASRRGYIDLNYRKSLDEKMEPIVKMITGLIRHLSKSELVFPIPHS